MRYRLRTLLILTILGPPVIAAIFWEAKALGLAMLLVDALALGIAGATLAFCFSFLRGPR
jgi:hypothetical protein